MKVIICGAGQVGYNIARYLASEGNDLTVVDQRPELIRKLASSLDVKALIGHAAHPDVLEEAGAADADMLIAVTAVDEVNMVACHVAHTLFHVPKKIARIRSQVYLESMWCTLFSRSAMPIDVIISPEVEVARAMIRRLKVPGALDIIPMVNNRVQLVGVRCHADTPVINTPLKQLSALFPDLQLAVVGIMRDGKPIMPSSETQMVAGDDVYFVVATDQLARGMVAFGQPMGEARRVMILGGGNVGAFVARQIELEHPEVSVHMIEADQARAEAAARALKKTVVLHGSALDPEILEEAGASTAEMVLAVTNDDEINILASLLAKKQGCRRALALLNSNAYSPLTGSLGIDVVVDPRAITVSHILQHVRRGRIHAVHALHEGFGELIEADAMETSGLVGRPLREAKIPAGVFLGAIVHGDKVSIPRGHTVVQTGDRVVLFAAPEAVKKVEKMFAVRLEYF